ncbi:Bromodomain protein [Zostera marina]|uniref:Bromodomain protein n=1 Tax=Zostera marina TaxID=29655 RepID=A0A0K9Q4S6_ZOSMR|nr:Bromodomain protein [Zostera marina]
MGKNTATVLSKSNDNNPKKKRKKGRPSLLDIQKRALRLIKQQEQQNPNSENQTKTTNISCLHFHPIPSNDHGLDFASIPSNSDPTPPSSTKKIRKLVDVHGSSGETIERQLLSKPKLEKDRTMELEEMTTPLPNTLLLYFILDRLQNKDTYGVFSEPVDHEELPDYRDIIENPMDFSTVRKKLSDGAYPNLETFEEDVFLISSNAMRYNSPDTIYFRQAKSIHDLAKKDFENLRQESDDENGGIYASESKIMQRGGMLPGKSTMETKDNSIDKAVLFNVIISGDESSSVLLRSISMRHRKKITVSEENDRSFQSTHKPSALTIFKDERKELIPVGLHMEHTYTRSLARFAADLGPVGWAIAAKQIERVLYPGTNVLELGY